MTKIAHVQPKGMDTMHVYYDEKAKTNPYRVYLEGYHHTYDYEGIAKHKRQVVRYADLASAMNALYQYALNHNEEGR